MFEGRVWGRWDGQRAELSQREGLAQDGTTLPARYFQALQGGRGLPEHYYSRMLPNGDAADEAGGASERPPTPRAQKI